MFIVVIIGVIYIQYSFTLRRGAIGLLLVSEYLCIFLQGLWRRRTNYPI